MAWARFSSLDGGVIEASGVDAVTHDIDDVDSGFWAVVLTFEGELTAVRMSSVTRGVVPTTRTSGWAGASGGWTASLGDTAYVGLGGRTNGAGIQQLAGHLATVGLRTQAVTVERALHLKSAVTALKQAGFTPSVSEEPTTDPAEDGVVTNQFPPAGSRGQRGDLVTITVGALTP